MVSPDTFYTGRLADDIIADLREHGELDTFYTGSLADDIIADFQEHGESRYILHWKLS